VCLALMPCAERDAILLWMQSSGNAADALPPDEAALRLIQQQGYMALDSERYWRTPGRPSSIAVPILHDGHFIASLTLIYFATALRQEHAVARYMPLLRAESQAIAAKLAS
jgi:IclR family mhp operon transcriptional activator